MKKIFINAKKKKSIINIDIFAMQIVYIFAFAVIGIYLSYIMPKTAYIDLLFLVIISCFAIYTCYREIQEKKHRIDELTVSLENAMQPNLYNVGVPMAMISNTTNIIWQNNLCKHLIPEEYIIDTSVKLQKNKNNGDKMQTQLEFSDSNIYIAIGNEMTLSSNVVTLIMFVDDSKQYELNKLLNNEHITVGMLFVDNFDETLQGLDEITKSDIISRMDKEIRKWVMENKGVVARVEKDKYILLIEKQYTQKMEQNSFEILEKIKNLTDITKLPITISIGFSYSNDTLDQRYIEANSALDIALGRGGDQVVVKNDKHFNFYGGNSIGLEKTNKVRARTISQALRELISKSDYVYIIGHRNTDIDCIGAAIGVSKIAKVEGKPYTVIVDDKYNSSTQIMIDKLKMQSDYSNAFVSKEELNIKKLNTENALLVVVDTHKKTYLAANDVLEKFDKVVVIDHHRRGPEFIDNAIITYHELYSSSTCELVTELLMYMEDIELTPIEAEALYAGILVDTKNFTFKTGVRTFEVAAYLKKSGMDITDVKQMFKNDLDTYIIKADIVKNAQITEDKIAISSTDAQHDSMPVIAAQAADELLTISGVLASFVLCKVDNVVMISGRSLGDINVQEILEEIGGGGHLTFAGAQIAGVEIEEAKKILVDSIKKHVESHEEKD